MAATVADIFFCVVEEKREREGRGDAARRERGAARVSAAGGSAGAGADLLALLCALRAVASSLSAPPAYAGWARG